MVQAREWNGIVGERRGGSSEWAPERSHRLVPSWIAVFPRTPDRLGRAGNCRVALATVALDRAAAATWNNDGDPRGFPTIAANPSEVVRCWTGDDAIDALRSICGRSGCGDGAWLFWLSYELGRTLEPTSSVRQRRASAWPVATFFRCDPAPVPHAAVVARPFCLGPWRSETGRSAFERDVARVIELLRAGDAFQVNLAHRLRATFEGCPRALAQRLGRRANARYGALLEDRDGEHGRIVLSLSPELFLSFDPLTRRAITRPMKGTRAGDADPSELVGCEKDRAELDMIVDLSRNDLSRECEPGTVRVESRREIERHATGDGAVLQAVATVSGRVRDERTPADLILACFPPGSVTGAPKVRAMQIIDSLEPVARGPYCGCVGVMHDSGRCDLAVSIRTLCLRGRVDEMGVMRDATAEYHAGAGIVLDSLPEAEWHETLAKARMVTGADPL
ncbi:MAG: anthranilate synthase component I family protein [Phycisphaeraceae bacterium]|nr:anthranilate synthase component I family protein [Phycisphaeraceae bacterium]